MVYTIAGIIFVLLTVIIAFFIGFKAGKNKILKKIDPKGVLHMDLNTDNIFSLELNGVKSVAELLNDGYIILDVHNDTKGFKIEEDTKA